MWGACQVFQNEGMSGYRQESMLGVQAEAKMLLSTNNPSSLALYSSLSLLLFTIVYNCLKWGVLEIVNESDSAQNYEL